MEIHHITNSRFAKFINANITLYPFIFYIGVPTKDVIAHEMCHVAQIAETSWLGFYLSYILYYLAELARGRNGYMAYMNIPYEVEAYGAQAISKKKLFDKAVDEALSGLSFIEENHEDFK